MQVPDMAHLSKEARHACAVEEWGCPAAQTHRVTQCVIDSLGLSSLQVTVLSRGTLVMICFATQIYYCNCTFGMQ